MDPHAHARRAVITEGRDSAVAEERHAVVMDGRLAVFTALTHAALGGGRDNSNTPHFEGTAKYAIHR